MNGSGHTSTWWKEKSSTRARSRSQAEDIGLIRSQQRSKRRKEEWPQKTLINYETRERKVFGPRKSNWRKKRKKVLEKTKKMKKREGRSDAIPCCKPHICTWFYIRLYLACLEDESERKKQGPWRPRQKCEWFDGWMREEFAIYDVIGRLFLGDWREREREIGLYCLIPRRNDETVKEERALFLKLRGSQGQF